MTLDPKAAVAALSLSLAGGAAVGRLTAPKVSSSKSSTREPPSLVKLARLAGGPNCHIEMVPDAGPRWMDCPDHVARTHLRIADAGH